MAKKGDLQAQTHLNIGLDNEMGKRLKESATKFERTLTQEARYALRKYLGMDATPAEDSAGVSA
jgi:predicted transcriptional regulator